MHTGQCRTSFRHPASAPEGVYTVQQREEALMGWRTRLYYHGDREGWRKGSEGDETETEGDRVTGSEGVDLEAGVDSVTETDCVSQQQEVTGDIPVEP
ncbi:hypothetical protein KIPB_015457 [Kipferlia bialata]|uniref:Uncharacterized protein n=1 Tax=Kipferlia bialata TaxID=797122 RepID=A0A391NY19_9EUKA|nr:hypothetical protein KIPB_015457 [Kipferlia bialata]|eukprot:g15457.t1